MRPAVTGKDAGRPAAVPRPDDEPAGVDGGCPDAFARRYMSAYRTAYRLLGDADRAGVIARTAVAVVEAALVPRAERVQTVRVCRAAGLAALRVPEEETPASDDERAHLR